MVTCARCGLRFADDGHAVCGICRIELRPKRWVEIDAAIDGERLPPGA